MTIEVRRYQPGDCPVHGRRISKASGSGPPYYVIVVGSRGLAAAFVTAFGVRVLAGGVKN
jgi:hypothetical protein